jgi:hypothetical protein
MDFASLWPPPRVYCGESTFRLIDLRKPAARQRVLGRKWAHSRMILLLCDLHLGCTVVQAPSDWLISENLWRGRERENHRLDIAVKNLWIVNRLWLWILLLCDFYCGERTLWLIDFRKPAARQRALGRIWAHSRTTWRTGFTWSPWRNSGIKIPLVRPFVP